MLCFAAKLAVQLGDGEPKYLHNVHSDAVSATTEALKLGEHACRAARARQRTSHDLRCMPHAPAAHLTALLGPHVRMPTGSQIISACRVGLLF